MTGPDEPFRFAGRTLRELATIAGSTPAYLYDAARLDERVAILRRSLPADVRLHYSLKANPMPALVSRLVGNGVHGLDIASIGELHTALGSGIEPSRISFSGPGKRDAELLAACGAGALVHAESLNEIERLAALAKTHALTPRLSLRVNPDFTVRRSGMAMGGGSRPFGIDSESVGEAIDRARQLGLTCEGLHCYPASQVLDADTLIGLHQATLALLSELAADSGLHAPSLNIGGGFGVPYFPHEAKLDLERVGAALHEAIRTACARCEPGELIVETGRWLVADAGLYLTRVVDRKRSRDGDWLIVDGGMNHHLAASGNLGQVIRRNYPVVAQALNASSGDSGLEVVSVAGPLCTPLDLLADKVQLRPLEPGDLFAVRQSGAYGSSASPQGFLSHPAPVEVLL